MSSVFKCSVTGDPLALSLIKGVPAVGVLAWFPPVSAEVVLLLELVQEIIPFRVWYLEQNHQFAVGINLIRLKAAFLQDSDLTG